MFRKLNLYGCHGRPRDHFNSKKSMGHDAQPTSYGQMETGLLDGMLLWETIKSHSRRYKKTKQ